MLTYRQSRLSRILLLVSAGVFGFLFVGSVFQDEFLPLGVMCFAPLTLAFAILLIKSDHRIEADPHEVRVYGLKHERQLRWDEIARVTSSTMFGTLELRDRDDKIVARLSSQVEWYFETVEWLRSKRPDLWEVNLPLHIRPSRQSFWLVTSLGLFMVFVGINGVHLKQPAIGFTMLIVGVLLMGTILDIKAVILETDALRIKSILREQRIAIKDIEAIGLTPFTNQGVKKYVTSLILIDGKTVTLDNLSIGAPVLYNILQAWRQKNSASSS